ncbi:pre-rRNA-processing protein esf1 [Coemansia sp. RSA 1813]|nr:pre-rRNA-processing protein esf1 [Coemansia sp. RSA 1646]KAJ1769516.1 pre-rRNA-processing protein esf1 [Coemansia sp. RSA 1843]KAJ2087470.1 pre-rRNA-processing protein esf1 [Coemansia sp. RSA 986]KAJ2211712.1 pre-rRNA-processing protein esf1 [Coemansia sp. RSA 487]KAJ2566649.1 pre-rRNA-processing protein esf1 [Coemansia sp. RSA 1813]
MAPQKASGKPDTPVKKVTTDPRFSHVQNDPRFSRPKKAQSKVKVDKRFAHMIKDKAFTESTKVDRYGRATEDNRAKAYLNRTYDFSGESEDNGSDEQDAESEHGPNVHDGSEDESSEDESSEDESSEDEGETVVDRARGHGVASDESSDSELDSDISDVEWGKAGGMQDGGLSDLDEDPDEIPRGEETKRFACINMDWSNVRAVDLLAVFSGFTPETGSVIAVKIYPSEFGKEHMAREEVEGPPREMFEKPAKHASKKPNDEDSDDEENELIKEQVQEDEEIDHVALRRYEIQKMRYYYAIVECDSVETAKAICTMCDGSEYESSANFFDLRYVPDGMEFDNAPKDEAMHVPEKYEPLGFVTHALMNSKAEITWDADAPSRSKITRRNLTHADIDNLDFDNLLASASSSDGSDNDEEELAKKRSLLLMGASKDSDEDEDDDANIGDMEITFTPGLSGSASARIDADEDAENLTKRSNETPIERFHRMKKERRERWKEIQRSKKPGSKGKRADDDNLISDNELDPAMAGDAFFTHSDDEFGEKTRSSNKKTKRVTESKSERRKRLEAKDKERAELELLLDGPEAERKHFDIAEIVKAEKNKGKKGKRGKKANDVQDDFKLDTSDPRFGALYESHKFALDPNNPNFKKTKAMKDLLNESRKRRKHAHS